MEIKYTKHFLNKLEDVFAESDYHLRYEKGKFKSGYCVLKDTKIVMVNKYYTLEGKVNVLIDILKSMEIDTSELTDKNKQFYAEINQRKLDLWLLLF